MLDYKLLEALAMVAQEGGFDKAAQRLHITQSAVSQRIKSLEDLTGQILVARTSPPAPTAAGKRLLAHVYQVQHLEHDLFGDLGKQVFFRQQVITLAINADSLATWFLPAIQELIHDSQMLIDIRVDDQEQTHKLLRDGEVVACISTRKLPLQGCRVEYLGTMTYQLLAAPAFADRWFADGLTHQAISDAPAIIFNRKDELHNKLLSMVLGPYSKSIPASFIPSSERFADCIVQGLGYGMLPQQQGRPFLQSGKLLDLAPDHSVPVDLYWHCWNLESSILEKLTRTLKSTAAPLLK